jgi:hypothetical protein
VSGKANKARRKQERLRQRRHQAQHPAVTPDTGDVCPLYRDPPDGDLYSAWIEGGSIRQTLAWSKAVMRDQRADGPDMPDLAMRIPHLAAIYGRMLPSGPPGNWTATSTPGTCRSSGHLTTRSPWCRPPGWPRYRFGGHEIVKPIDLVSNKPELTVCGNRFGVACRAGRAF